MNFDLNKRIIVIGAGISGITTAVTLQLLGFDQTIGQIEERKCTS